MVNDRRSLAVACASLTALTYAAASSFGDDGDNTS